MGKRTTFAREDRLTTIIVRTSGAIPRFHGTYTNYRTRMADAGSYRVRRRERGLIVQPLW